MKPTFVAISDLHAHPWAAFARGDGGSNTRLQLTLGVLRASLARAQQDGVPWLCGGDIVHTAGYALNVVLSELLGVLCAFPEVPKLAVWGNHDARGVGGRISLQQTVWAALEQAVPNLIVLDPSRPRKSAIIQGVTYAGAGAQPRAMHPTYADPSVVGLYHGSVRGAVGANGYVFAEGLDPQELLRRHRVSVVGDLHFPQQIAAPDGQAILIPGAPEHHNFGDFGEFGWWVVSLPDDHDDDCPLGIGGDCECRAQGQDPTVEFVPGASPEFRTVDTPDQVVDSVNYYRVRHRPAGSVLPVNATAIAPEPTVVEARTTLRGARGDAVLQAWLEESAPAYGPGMTREHFMLVGRGLLTSHEPRQLQPARLASVQLDNFCSYVDQEFVVQPGTWLVVGKGRDYPSNGAGKSSLFEAMFWLLFGRTTKGLSGDEVIRRGASSCAVTGVIEGVDGHHLKVTRSRGTASVLRVVEFGPAAATAWEAASVNEMTEKLVARLGLTPELYQALGYFSQERLMLFASATDGERKEMLADLIGLSAYQDASAQANHEAAQIAVKVQRACAFKEAAEAHAAAERVRLASLAQQADAWAALWAELRAQADAAVQQFAEKRIEYRDRLMVEARAQFLSSFGDQRTVLLQREAAVVAKLKELPATWATPQQLAEVREAFQAASEQAVAARALLQALERQHSDVAQRLEQRRSVLAQGKCPTCAQDVTPAHRAACVAPDEQAVQEVDELLAAGRTRCDGLAKAVLDLKLKFEAAELSVRQGRESSQLSAQLSDVRNDLDKLQKGADVLESVAAAHVDGVLAEQLKQLLEASKRVRAEVNPHASERAASAQRIVSLDVSIAAHAAEIVALQQQQAVYEYWSRGFSKQGIQSLLVDEVAALFNDARGSIFPALTQGVYDVQFSTTSKTKGGDARERTEFRIFEHGQLIPYAWLSGGQRRRIDVGVMLVLVKAVSRWMQVPGVLGMLALDEVFGFLDASGAEGLMEALREVQLVVPTIYAVSHDQQLQALFSDVVMVEQDQDGVSHIVNGQVNDSK